VKRATWWYYCQIVSWITKGPFVSSSCNISAVWNF